MKVLIAYDGSDCAKGAIEDLRRAGLPLNTDALVLSVADVYAGLLKENLPPDDPLANPAIQRLASAPRAKAKQEMSDARALAAHGADRVSRRFPTWKVSHLAVAESPVRGILAAARDFQADLVVVGSHGRSALGRTLLGSVSQSILHHAPCSVRIGRSDSATGSADRPVRILLGVDGSLDAATAISAVQERTWPPGSEVEVVSVLDFRVFLMMMMTGPELHGPPYPRVPTASDQEGQTLELLERVSKELRASGLSAKPAIREGDPKRVLVREARDWRADCIFVGARGITRIKRILIGSVSASVAAHAHCSVEVARYPGD